MASMMAAVAASPVSVEVAARASRMALKGCQKEDHSTLLGGRDEHARQGSRI